jgi:hypothetical protein
MCIFRKCFAVKEALEVAVSGSVVNRCYSSESDADSFAETYA